jgi:hypothetical protein
MEMLTQIPWHVSITFFLAVIVTVYYLRKSVPVNSRNILLLSVLWLAAYAGLGVAGFFRVNNTIPPRFMLLLMPSVLVMVTILATKKGRAWALNLSLFNLIMLSSSRILVELVLDGLYHAGFVPVSMTYEGHNFDMISGVSAPVIAYFCVRFQDGGWRKSVLLIWNILALGLVLNVLITGIFSVPSPIQQWAFQNPNVAILHFPFVWLPGFIVPVVLFSHVVIFMKLLRIKNNSQ